jgi:hypothetical protein
MAREGGRLTYGEESSSLVGGGESGMARIEAEKPKQSQQSADDEGMLPVLIEEYLERAGVM